MTRASLIAVLAVAGTAATSSAAISVTTLGDAAPPASLTAAAPDAQPTFVDTTSADLGGPTVDFSIPLSHRVIGGGWGSWSHGYAGDVYYTNGAASVTMDLTGEGVVGFYFYAESNPFAIFSFTATASDGTSSTQDIDGNGGAGGWLFEASGGMQITTITVSTDDGFTDFAIGEFGYAVPAPGAATLGLMGLGLVARRRR